MSNTSPEAIRNFTWTTPSGAIISFEPSGVTVSIRYSNEAKGIFKFYKLIESKGGKGNKAGIYLNKDGK